MAAEQKKILIVDDDADTRFIIRRTLSRDKDYIIEEVCDGREVSEKLKTFKPDLIVLDIKLPGENGYEVCMYIRDTLKMHNVRIIAISGVAGGIGDSIMHALGADCFFPKPVDNDRFIHKVCHLLEKSAADSVLNKPRR